MGQATTTITKHPVYLETLRLQLGADGKVYKSNRHPVEARERLLHTLRTNDCREIMATVVDGDDIASAFVTSGCKGHADLLEAFLNHGINIDSKDEGGSTALMYASCNEHEQCVQVLLDHNAGVDVQNNGGCTALLYASLNGHIKIVEMLLAKTANPDLQNNTGMTALMYASSYGHKEVFQLLLHCIADIELKNNDGKTALDLTLDEEIKELIRNHMTTGYVLK